MFRRLSSTLPKDPEFPAYLKGLGYFITDKDQIRSINHPDHDFNFFISKNDRVNEKQREAMNTCIRANLSPRFTAAGLLTTHLPFNPSANSPPSTPHIPILTSTHFRTAPRLILYFGESVQDLGIFAYRTIGQVSLAAGSCLDFAHALHPPSTPTPSNHEKSSDTGIIIANCGQLIWHRRGARAVTQQTWNSLPQKYGTDGIMSIDPVKNRVEGHRSVEEHIASVMAFVDTYARKDVQLDIIGMGDASEKVVAFLNANWKKWAGRVEAVVIGMAYLWLGDERNGWNSRFREFWGRRARILLLSDTPTMTPLSGRDSFGANCYSSGEPSYIERMMPAAGHEVLTFFGLVSQVPGYAEVEMPSLIRGEVGDEGEKVEKVERKGERLVEVVGEGGRGGLVS